MPDVFLSYSREDQQVARLFAQGLEREGFTVWWDQALRPGETYDKVTETALREARAVVVLWSKTSVESRWVRAEATTADRIGTLLPAMIEPCDRPIMFELTHTAELSHWRGDVRDPAWRAYVEEVRRHVQMQPGASQASQANPAAMPSDAQRAIRVSRLPGRWIAVIAVTGTLLVAGTLLLPELRGKGSAAEAVRTATSVAVMPFANVTGDPGKDYIGDGIAEELINALAKVPGLTVPSRTSSFAYKGRNVEVKTVASDLNVESVLEGSVRIAGDRIRINAQLIDARADRTLWSESYERTTMDLFALQDELARKIVAAVRDTKNVQLPELEVAKPLTSDPEAYALYLQGNAFSQRNAFNGAAQAIAAFRKALERDPGFGEAYLGVATAMYIYGTPLEEVEASARKAAELKPELSAVVARLLAGVAARRGRWIEAEEIYRTTLTEPENATLPSVLTDRAIGTQWATGHLKETLTTYDEARRLAPAAAGVTLSAGRAYAAAGRYDEAARLVSIAVASGVEATGRQALQLYAEIAAHEGRYDDAAARMVSALSESARAAGGEAVVRRVYAAIAGKSARDAAVPALRTLLSKLPESDWVVRVWAMNWYTQLGSLDDAFAAAEWLRKAFQRQAPTNAWSWLWSTELRALRADPRFSDFTKSLGMHEYWRRFGPPDDCELSGSRLACR
ncbi:MAG TPA: TIR domain-containing protein [Steroidobacteraceae bacterium]|nr:TIR domain-containing protein [Steroidobacteraceae bacterium]